MISVKPNLFRRCVSGFLKSGQVPLPHSLVIEVTSCCNLRCCMCPKTHDSVNTEADQVMTEEVFDRIRPLFPMLTAVELSGLWGEIFLHPDLYLTMLRALKEFPINVSSISNGTLLTDDVAQQLVELKLDRLVISMDAAKAETYAGIRPPGKLEDVIAGLKSLGAWKAKLNSSLPRVEVVFLGLKRNIEEFPEFVRNAAALGAAKVSLQALGEYEQVKGESVAAHYKDLGKRIFAEAAELGHDQGIEVELFPADQFDEQRDEHNLAPDFTHFRKHCPDLWTKAIITTSGDVLPCCSMTRSIGNLAEGNFEDIWYGDAYMQLRSAIMSDEPPNACRVCTGMPWVEDALPHDKTLAGFLVGLKTNRELGRNPLYCLVKPPLKILRNALCGRL